MSRSIWVSTLRRARCGTGRNTSTATKVRSTEDQIAYIAELVDKYDLVYVEDPLHEDDFDAFANSTARSATAAWSAATTSLSRRSTASCRASRRDAANCVLIKPNQVGTLTDTFDAVQLAHTHGLDTVMSHRSGETTDTTIAHLATAFSCVFLKCGIVGGERIAKLNELIRIEEQL